MAAAGRKHGDALLRIVGALGGIRLLAVECNVSTWTVRACLDGSRAPSPASQRRLNEVAQGLGVRVPYPQWAGLRRRPGEAQFEEVIHRLRLKVTARERQFGFAYVELHGRVCVVARLRPGLFAVKVVRDDGVDEYAVCDEWLRPLYRSAESLRDLRRRFRVEGP